MSQCCNNCGGVVEKKGGRLVCKFCGMLQAQEITTEESSLLFVASQKLRMASFDEAEELYQDIVSKFNNSYEAYWGLVLSKYCIKYELDNDTNKAIPTVFANSIESILDDVNYKKCLHNADLSAKQMLVSEGQKLEELRLEWIEKAVKEEPYDVFICYKDSDVTKGIDRVKDSYEMHELYTHLIQQGFRVFFSRESLRQKIAEKYEPYVYQAISTAKVMIVYGSEVEYFTSTWMQNEWYRFLKLIENKQKMNNSLIVAYDKIKLNDLPTKLRNIQCLDASKKTFYIDIVNHIRKILEQDSNGVSKIKTKKFDITVNNVRAETIGEKTIKKVMGASMGNMQKKRSDVNIAFKRRDIGVGSVVYSADDSSIITNAYNLLANAQWKLASELFEQLLEKNANYPTALVGMVHISLKAKNKSELVEKIDLVDDVSIFNNAIDNAEKDYATEVLNMLSEAILISINSKEYEIVGKLYQLVCQYNFEAFHDMREKLVLSLINQLQPIQINNVLAVLDIIIANLAENESDVYVEINNAVSQKLLQIQRFNEANQYINDVLSYDQYEFTANCNKYMCSTYTMDLDDFVFDIQHFSLIDDIDNYISNANQTDGQKMISFWIGVIEKGIREYIKDSLSIKGISVLRNIFNVVIQYEFNQSGKFVQALLNCFVKETISVTKDIMDLFDSILLAIPQTDKVDWYVSLLFKFAGQCKLSGLFNESLIYYNRILDIQPNNSAIHWKILCSKLGVVSETTLYTKIHLFEDFKQLDTVMSCSEIGERQFFALKLLSSVNRAVKEKKAMNCEVEFKLFDNFLEYYPEGESMQGDLVATLLSTANICKTNRQFEIAIKYYNLCISVCPKAHDAYWGIIQSKYNCENDKQLLDQNNFVDSLNEYKSAIMSSSGEDNEKYLNFMIKHKKIVAERLKNKKKIRTLIIALAVIFVVIAIGIIILS